MSPHWVRLAQRRMCCNSTTCAREASRLGADPATLGRTEWLDSRREELVDRMHTRRERDFGVGYGRSSGYGRASYIRTWRPGVFKVR